METIEKKDLKKAENMDHHAFMDPRQPKMEITDNELDMMLDEMQHPVKAQQRIAVQIKIFLEKRIKQDLEEKGYLTDHTRRWVETYNNLLEKIQKSLYGDKSVNLHMHKVTHSSIATEIRKYTK